MKERRKWNELTDPQADKIREVKLIILTSEEIAGK